MTYAPYLVYTPDEDFVLEKDDISGGGGGGGDGLVVPTFTETGVGQFSCDMTFADVNSAVKSGKCCYALLDTTVFTLSEYYEDETVIFANFIIGGGVFKSSLAYDTTGITYDEQMYPEE